MVESGDTGGGGPFGLHTTAFFWKTAGPPFSPQLGPSEWGLYTGFAAQRKGCREVLPETGQAEAKRWPARAGAQHASVRGHRSAAGRRLQARSRGIFGSAFSAFPP